MTIAIWVRPAEEVDDKPEEDEDAEDDEPEEGDLGAVQRTVHVEESRQPTALRDQDLGRKS